MSKPLDFYSTPVRLLFWLVIILLVVDFATNTIAVTSTGSSEDVLVLAGLSSLLMALCQYGLAISFVVWLWQAHKSIGQAGLKDLDYTPKWALIGFVIPFANFVLPVLVVNETWRGSMFLQNPDGYGMWTTVKAPPIAPL